MATSASKEKPRKPRTTNPGIRVQVSDCITCCTCCKVINGISNTVMFPSLLLDVYIVLATAPTLLPCKPVASLQLV